MTNRPTLAPKMIRAAICLLITASLFTTGCIMRDVARNAVEYVGNIVPEGGDSYGKRVVVIPFSAGTRKVEPLARDLTAFLSGRLDKTNSYNRIAFEELAAKMNESAKGLSLTETMMTTARNMGINAIITGAVTDLSLRYRLKGLYGLRENTPFLILEAQVRLADPVTGVVFSEKTLFEEVEIEEFDAHNIRLGQEMDPKKVANLLAEIKPQALDWLEDELSDLNWGGVVLDVVGNQALITVGQDSGFSQGQRLAVIARGERLKAANGHDIYLPGEVVGHIQLKEIGKWESWAELIPQEPEEKLEKPEQKTAQAKEGAPKPQTAAKQVDLKEKPVMLPNGKVLPLVKPGQVVKDL